jgi:hypothetical protein
MGRNSSKITAVMAGVAFALTGCTNNSADEASTALTKKLYIASGQCNSGPGVTSFGTQNSSRRVSKLNLATKELSVLLDLTEPYVGGTFGIDTGAQALVNDGSNILMLTENAVAMSDRKIYSIPKASPFNTEIYSQDPLALTQTNTHITRALVKDVDGALLFSKSLGIEKIGINTLRIPQGANSWVNAPAGTCAASATFMSAMSVLPPFTGSSSGKIVFAHAGATAASNRLGIINADGYSVAANCLNGYQISSTLHTYAANVTGPAIAFSAAAGSAPTAAVFIKTADAPGVIGKLVVAYSAAVNTETSNNTNLNYALVAWDVTETSATVASLSAPVVLSRQLDAVFGISALAYDETSKVLYVATASQTGVMNQTTAGYGYKIEKFLYDPLTANEATLVRENNQPFMERTSGTKCITSMVLGEE